MESAPEFYTGAPVDPVDLRFREAFLAELWQTLSTGHVVLTAPRRTGKTSVMDYLRDHPEKGFSVVAINVQDLTHPADFFQVLLDGFHDAYPDFVRDQLAAGWKLVSGVLGKVDEIDVGGVTPPAHERRQIFNQLLLDLENDFYIAEVEEGVYDFASGVLKSWWRKYHA